MIRPCPVVVGRDDELGLLRQAFEDAIAGHGRSVCLIGEPGIGKSRLTSEVEGWAAARRVPVLRGRAVPDPSPAAYRPVTEALMPLLNDRPIPSDPVMARWLPVLHPLFPTVVPPSVDRGEITADLRAEAVLQLLGHLDPGAIVVVFEDLQWADSETASLIGYLLDNLARLPVLAIVTLSNESGSPALDALGARHRSAATDVVRLERLGAEDARAMLRACRSDVSDETVERIRRSAEGVPLLIEELLASPGLPTDLASTVRARLDALAPAPRVVVQAAALLDDPFDWSMLAAMTDQDPESIAAAMQAAMDVMLLAGCGETIRFRHGLTRAAVLEAMLPPLRRRLAAAGLAALTSSGPTLGAERRELAVRLARSAGDRALAGSLESRSGREHLESGALAAAVEHLRRADDLLAGRPERDEVELDLIEALALIGRIDDAAQVGARLNHRLLSANGASSVRVESHLRLAEAAVASSRWRMARHHLDHATSIVPGPPCADSGIRIALIEADLAMAIGDHDTAAAGAHQVLDEPEVRARDRCRALDIIGRTRRGSDLDAARPAFEEALVIAEATDLPLCRLQALHELGTVDLLDHAGVAVLHQARDRAEQMGALATSAVLDLQLSAAYACRWDLDPVERHAVRAAEIAECLNLGPVTAKAHAMLAGNAGMRADLDDVARWTASTSASAPGDGMLEGFCLAARAMALLLIGRDDDAVDAWSRSSATLARLPHAEPASARALWPLVLAARADRRAGSAIAEARTLGVGVVRLNRSLLGYAEAILVGRRGEAEHARSIATTADDGWSNCETWRDLARMLAAPSARADRWADVDRWMTGTAERFTALDLPEAAERCLAIRSDGMVNAWRPAGVTAREAEVLRLVAEGLTNKEIADRLQRSSRTVEKHVESLFRKTGARTRTELVSLLVLPRPLVPPPAPVPSRPHR